MIRKPVLLIALIGGIFAYSANRADAQPYGANPPLSPWLYLNQKQPGPVDNYHMYVQPQQQLRSTLQSQQADIQRNGATFDSLGQQVMTAQQAFNSPAAPTGVGASFMTHGSYFNTNRLQNSGVNSGPGGAFSRNTSGPGMSGGFGGAGGVPSLSSIGGAGGVGGLGR